MSALYLASKFEVTSPPQLSGTDWDELVGEFFHCRQVGSEAADCDGSGLQCSASERFPLEGNREKSAPWVFPSIFITPITVIP